MPPMLFTALVGLIFNLLMPGLLPERLQFAARLEAKAMHAEARDLAIDTIEFGNNQCTSC